jgi:Ca-activated chloride channel family protein
MRKLAYATAGLALCGIAAAVVIPNFLNFRLKAKSSESKSNLGAIRSTEITHTGAPFAASEDAAPSAPPPRKAMKPKSRADRSSVQVMAYSNEQGAKPLPQEYVGRDRFEKITPNPVKVTAEEPVSTFSIDVDTASYAFVRRALNGGHLPQKNAVRIEEMINYFDYDYPLPSDRSAPFRPTVTVFPTPWNTGTKILHIGIKGLDLTPEEKPSANLVFLLDVSGSMNMPDKLPLLKNSFRMLVETLDPEDSVAIVVYAGAAGTILEPTRAGERGRIIAALDRLRAGGSTAGGAGIRQAYALAEENYDPEGVNRVILATDGDFNVGIRNPEELKNFVERKRKTGIYLSVLGFGQGNLNDELMQKLAQNGNGNAAYIDTLSEARKVLVDEAGGTLFTVAKDVKIQIEFNPAAVAEYRLIGYETRLLKREDFRNDKVDAGDVGSGHTVTAVYEITPAGSAARMIDDLRYGRREDGGEEMGETGEYAFLKIRYKLPDESKSRLITTPVGREREFESIDGAPGEARFAVAVAAFGQLLRDDPYTKDFSWDDVIDLARPARGEDPFGYRSEFLNLVRLAETARAMGDR